MEGENYQKNQCYAVNDGVAAGGRGHFSQGPRGGGGGGGGFRGGNNRFRSNDGFRGRGGSYNPNGYPRMEFRTRGSYPTHQVGRGSAVHGGSDGGSGATDEVVNPAAISS